jgi:hypothetical protein
MEVVLMKLDEDTKMSSDGKQEEAPTRQFTLCQHSNNELTTEQVIRARIGHVIGDDEEIFLCDHVTLCKRCYNELAALAREYIGYCHKNGGVGGLWKPNELTVGINLREGPKIEGKWVLDDVQRKAAWEMYVELVTRISVAELKEDEGLLREALTSLYSLFNTTRQILREYGPSVAKTKWFRKSDLSLGYIAVAILNRELRPLLAKWHPLLQDYEASKPQDVFNLEHERKWERAEELRTVLEENRLVLVDYAHTLAKAAKVPSLIVERNER